MRPGGTLQPFDIFDRKSECIGYAFVLVLSRISNHYDLIWLIVDQLTKSAHVILMQMEYTLVKFEKLYI